MLESINMNSNKIILQAITGSRAYGLNHEHSDTDRMGLFISPSVKVAGLDWNSKDESWSDAGPTGDDTTLHELGKFLRLVLKSNPTLIELLFMNEYEVLTEEGQGLVDIRDSVLYTEGIRSAYYGYAVAQYERVLREYPDHKPKMARHCLRITNQAVELLTTGSCSPRVADPQLYFDLDKMSFDKMSLLLGQTISRINTAESKLADKPDRKRVAAYLEEVRRNNVG
jgi:predicted nucleotidyltransferase